MRAGGPERCTLVDRLTSGLVGQGGIDQRETGNRMVGLEHHGRGVRPARPRMTRAGHPYLGPKVKFRSPVSL